MPYELLVAAWGCVLAFVHIMAAIQLKTRQYGVEWNMGARDGEQPPLNPVAARVGRAQANFFETFPIVLFAAVALVVAERTTQYTAFGAGLWLGARIVYLPLYWAGVPKLRTLVFLASVVGVGMMVWPLLTP